MDARIRRDCMPNLTPASDRRTAQSQANSLLLILVFEADNHRIESNASEDLKVQNSCYRNGRGSWHPPVSIGDRHLDAVAGP
jgi:hypothetical protein